MRKRILVLSIAMMAMLGSTISAHAADFDFATAQSQGFYGSTSYNDVYDTEYNYAGGNQLDFDIPEIQFGLAQDILEHSLSNPYLPSGTQYGLSGWESSDTSAYPEIDYGVPIIGGGDSVIEVTYQPMVSVNDLLQDDGSIGTVTISRVGLSAKVYEGATTETMAKGAGHYPGTGVWNGNIALFGHNRGSHPYFNALKKVKVGDTITYKTSLGTRTYTVTYVGNVSSTDYSRLNEMGDNRITLFTCIANQPSLRLCVQAVESK